MMAVKTVIKTVLLNFLRKQKSVRNFTKDGPLQRRSFIFIVLISFLLTENYQIENVFLKKCRTICPLTLLVADYLQPAVNISSIVIPWNFDRSKDVNQPGFKITLLFK
jgi:hypothetical protein